MCGSRTRSCRCRPSVRPGVLARRHPARARLAADRRVALASKRIDAAGVLDLIRLDLVDGPRGERVDLDQAVLGRPSRRAGCRHGSAPHPPYAGDPAPRRSQGPGERLDLAQQAAQVRVAVVQPRPVLGVLLGDGRLGQHVDHGHRQVAARRCRGSRGSRRSGSRCRGTARRRRAAARRQVGQHGVLHRAGHGEGAAKVRDRPGRDLVGRGWRSRSRDRGREVRVAAPRRPPAQARRRRWSAGRALIAGPPRPPRRAQAENVSPGSRWSTAKLRTTRST